MELMEGKELGHFPSIGPLTPGVLAWIALETITRSVDIQAKKEPSLGHGGGTHQEAPP